jgi:hypothetical protein
MISSVTVAITAMVTSRIVAPMITAWWLYCGSGGDATASEPFNPTLTSGLWTGAWLVRDMSSAAELHGFDDQQHGADDEVAA